MNTQQKIEIVGVMVVKNEDLHVERALRNVVECCDRFIIADNFSTDQTYSLVTQLAKSYPHVTVCRIEKLKDAHRLIETLAGSNTWVFSVDGDEIYDPAGLARMFQRLRNGEFADQWVIFGNVLHCTHIDRQRQVAKGYLAPPSRPMTKLYNFTMITSWTGCPFVLSGGTITFKPGYHDGLRYYLGEASSWEDASFRCLHTVFMRRSSLDQHNPVLNSRLNATETLRMKKTYARGRLFQMLGNVMRAWKVALRKDWKNQHYRRGALVEKDVSAFFPNDC